MDLNLFVNREKDNNSFIDKFLEELKNALKKFENKNQNNIPENNVLDEYNLFEKKKTFLNKINKYLLEWKNLLPCEPLAKSKKFILEQYAMQLKLLGDVDNKKQ